MSKRLRHFALQKLVREKTLRTQEALAAELARKGIEATQVTLSRDLRELAIVKTSEGYRERDAVAQTSASLSNLTHVLHEFLRESRVSQNLVVLKTNPGSANAVALALDTLNLPEIVGTVAGDDTIFIAANDLASAHLLERKLANL
jgi:transcriptional regulator of arginine metabolism